MPERLACGRRLPLRHHLRNAAARSTRECLRSELQRSRLTACINHYPDYPGNFSDRLAISLYAGRVHVTNRTPGAHWLPGPDHGLHFAETPARAVALYKSSAAGGNVYAMTALGDMYASGNGVKQDMEQASAWYRAAADPDQPKAKALSNAQVSSGNAAASTSATAQQ